MSWRKQILCLKQPRVVRWYISSFKNEKEPPPPKKKKKKKLFIYLYKGNRGPWDNSAWEKNSRTEFNQGGESAPEKCWRWKPTSDKIWCEGWGWGGHCTGWSSHQSRFKTRGSYLQDQGWWTKKNLFLIKKLFIEHNHFIQKMIFRLKNDI